MSSQPTSDSSTVPTSNSPNLSGLAEDVQHVKTGRKIPPLDKWHPELSGDMDLVIKANGEWFHEGTKMIRQKLVDLFATILWCETNEETRQAEYFLKSPVEKWRITVEDVPLMVTGVEQIEVSGVNWLQFRTQTGDVVMANADHPIQMRQYKNEAGDMEQRPYITIRTAGKSLDAFIHRNTFYHLVEMGKLVEENGETFLQLTSGDQTFTLHAN